MRNLVWTVNTVVYMFPYGLLLICINMLSTLTKTNSHYVVLCVINSKASNMTIVETMSCWGYL